MKINTLGSFLKYYRKKYNFSQEKLCSGICSMGELSQIENGVRVVDSLTAEVLLGRIGKNVLQFELLLNDKDYYLWNLREEIVKAEKEEKWEVVKQVLYIYKENMPLNKKVHLQFYLFHKAKCEIVDLATIEEIFELLYQALTITKPEIELGNTENLLYSPMEIELYILLLKYKFPCWKEKDAEEELLRLKYYVNRIYSGRQKEITGTKILMALIEKEQEAGSYIHALKYIDEAIQFISQGRSIDRIAELHFLKAQMIEKLYFNSAEWNIQKQNCLRECLMAYSIFNLLDRNDEIERLRLFCEGKIEWQIIKSEILFDLHENQLG